MEAMKSVNAEIKARGQLTIPKKIREAMNLEEGQVVSLIPSGSAVIITPRRLELDEAQREIKKILKQSRCSLDELISGLREERATLYDELYGEKDD